MGPGKKVAMAELYNEVRKMRTLETAWRRVRSRGILSASKEIRNEVALFDENPIRRLRSIQDRLRRKAFALPLRKA